MRINRESVLVWALIIFGLSGCDVNQEKSRLFIVQEVSLDDGRSLFWFKEVIESSKESAHYFQITNDKCDLSVKKALASCRSPVQIYDSSGDTIYILVNTTLVILKSDSWFSLKAVKYSPELYDSDKNPDPGKQFYLDTLCSGK
jgi:hypothetical protein